jgi:hypothetical protein
LTPTTTAAATAKRPEPVQTSRRRARGEKKMLLTLAA